MRRPTIALLPLLTACSPVNPIGFWDITAIDIEWEGEEQSHEDIGTWELGENTKGGGTVLRYRILDPSKVAADAVEDTAGEPLEEGSWFVPIYPPIVGSAPGESDDELTFQFGPIRFVDAVIEDYKGQSMTIFEEETSIGDAYGVDVRLYLER